MPKVLNVVLVVFLVVVGNTVVAEMTVIGEIEVIEAALIIKVLPYANNVQEKNMDFLLEQNIKCVLRTSLPELVGRTWKITSDLMLKSRTQMHTEKRKMLQLFVWLAMMI